MFSASGNKKKKYRPRSAHTTAHAHPGRHLLLEVSLVNVPFDLYTPTILKNILCIFFQHDPVNVKVKHLLIG